MADVSIRDITFTVNETLLRGYLNEMKYPAGLQEVVSKGIKSVPIRFFLIDDSGSMAESDGNVLVKSGNEFKMIQSTRWNELTQAMKFHVNLVSSSGSTAQFRFLNNAAPITLSPKEPDAKYTLTALLDGSPGGGTPLCRHIREIIAELQTMEASLRKSGQRACVIIATDGESSDGDIASAMKPLEHLPCFVVVRLCTNDPKVVEYWNNIDQQLELEIDVLDDLKGEAEEINEKNDWFTYGEPLHRLREFGIPTKELDLLDEKPLIPSQIRQIAHIIFGGSLDRYPQPEADPKAFLNYIHSAQEGLTQVYDPISKRLQPWFKMENLRKVIRAPGCCTVL